MNGSSWGGSEELWYQAALNTARRGVETGVCCFNGTGKEQRMDELKKAGCKLFLLPGKEITKRQPFIGKMKLNKAVANVPFEDYDKVIVSQGGWKDVTSGPFKKLYTRLKQYVLIYHNYNVNERFSNKKFSSLQKWADNALKNLGATPKIFLALKDSYSLDIPKQGVFFNPLTFSSPEKNTPFKTDPEEKVIFCMLAALDTERKAQDILLHTFGMDKWKDRNWELNLYGDGKDKMALEKIIEQLQLHTKVYLREHTQNVKSAIESSHLVLQITHMDGMPISVMEALSMSRPVVVSKVGDMPLWVTDNYNGWIADTVSIDGINQVLEKAWQNRSEWEEMGKNAFAFFRKGFPLNPIEHFFKQTGIIN